MVRGGFKRNDKCENEFSMKINNNILQLLCGASDVREFIKELQCNYVGHIVRASFDRATKKLMFNSDRYKKAGTVDGFCNFAMAKRRKEICDLARSYVQTCSCNR